MDTKGLRAIDVASPSTVQKLQLAGFVSDRNVGGDLMGDEKGLFIGRG